ncbi:MAG: hypothetical protein AB7U20_19915, partial [Planctomycetaceae bacterium]
TAASESWTEQDTRRAQEIWRKYQQDHDLSDRTGQTAGIDPRTGEVCFGESVIDISQQRKALGLSGPLFFERVGQPAYWRKGGRR